MSKGQLRWQPDNPTKSRRYCSVPGCGHRAGTMFTFPKDPALKQLWVQQCKIQREVSKSMTICRRHFTDSDVRLECAGPMKLRANAYPTLHLPDKVVKRSRRNCSVRTCSNGSVDADVLLHLFPRSAHVSRQWLGACKMPFCSKSSRVCSRHFTDSDYMYTDGERTLKQGAVPSVDLPQTWPPGEGPKSKKWIVMTPEGGLEIKSEPIAEAEGIKSEPAVEEQDEGSQSDASDAASEDGDRHGQDDDDDAACGLSDGEAAEQDAMDVDAPVVVSTTEVPDLAALDVIESELHNVQQLMESFIKSNLTSQVKAMRLNEIIPLDPLSCFDVASNGDKTLSVLDMIKTETQMQAFTGVSTYVVDCLAQLLTLIVTLSPDTELSMKQRVVMTLTKLRTNLGFEALGTFFGVDRQTSGKYFSSTIKLMSLILRPCIYWPTKEENFKTMPRYFTKPFDTVMLLDIVEIPLESTNCLKCHSELHAPNKGSSSIKFFAGVAPSGLIIYLSKVHNGMVANKKILETSDLIVKKLLQPKSGAIMVDKELRLDSVWSKNEIKVHHTPNSQKAAELINAKRQVEKALQKMKMFTILSGKLCTTTAPHIDDILTVIAGLVNLTSPLISSERIIAVKECAC